jgi:hypothetical protein
VRGSEAALDYARRDLAKQLGRSLTVVREAVTTRYASCPVSQRLRLLPFMGRLSRKIDVEGIMAAKHGKPH